MVCRPAMVDLMVTWSLQLRNLLFAVGGFMMLGPCLVVTHPAAGNFLHFSIGPQSDQLWGQSSFIMICSMWLSNLLFVAGMPLEKFGMEKSKGDFL